MTRNSLFFLQKLPTATNYIKAPFLKIAQNVAKYLGYFGNKNVRHDLSAIAQSGLTDTNPPDQLSSFFVFRSKYKIWVQKKRLTSRVRREGGGVT